MKLTVEFEQQEDGRWIAEVVDLPGVSAYGSAPQAAVRAVRVLALCVAADKIEHGELDAQANRVEFLLPQTLSAVGRTTLGPFITPKRLDLR